MSEAIHTNRVYDRKTGKMRRKHKMSSAQKAALRQLHAKPRTRATQMKINKAVKLAMRRGKTKFNRRVRGT